MNRTFLLLALMCLQLFPDELSAQSSSGRGEIRIIIYNSSQKDYIIKKHDKIAQLLIQRIESPEIVEVEELSNSERGKRTFGSSDK